MKKSNGYSYNEAVDELCEVPNDESKSEMSLQQQKRQQHIIKESEEDEAIVTSLDMKQSVIIGMKQDSNNIMHHGNTKVFAKNEYFPVNKIGQDDTSSMEENNSIC